MRRFILLLPALLLALCACNATLPVDALSSAEGKAEARKATIEHYPWPTYVTGEVRSRVESSLRTIFDVGGREMREAEEYIVELDRTAEASSFRAAGRLVSEMKTVMDTVGLDGYEGKSRIMVLDRMLRKIDGVQERLFKEEYGVDIEDSVTRVTRIIRNWNWWYQKGRLLTRYEPWDPRVDGEDYGDEE